MKTLLVGMHGLLFPHTECDLEILETLRNSKEDVFFLRCDLGLNSCSINLSNNLNTCAICQGRYLNALSVMEFPERKVLRLPKVPEDDPRLPKLRPDSIEDHQWLREYHFQEIPIGLGALSSWISFHKDHKPPLTTEARQMLVKMLQNAARVVIGFKALQAEQHFEKVVLHLGRFFDLRPIVEVCFQQGIAITTHTAGRSLDSYMFHPGGLIHHPKVFRETVEAYLPPPEAEEDFRAVGERYFQVKLNRKSESRVPIYTDKQELGRLPEGFNKKQKNIVIYDSSRDEIEAVDLHLPELRRHQTQAVKYIDEQLQDRDEVDVYWRVHPHMAGRDNTQLREIKEIEQELKKIKVIEADAEVDSYALLRSADVVFTFGSSVGFEGTYFGIPHLLLGGSVYQEFNLGSFAANYDELQHYLHNLDSIKVGDKEDAYRIAAFYLLRGTPFQYFSINEDGKELFFKGRRIPKSSLPKVLDNTYGGKVMNFMRYRLKVPYNKNPFFNLRKQILKGLGKMESQLPS